MKVIASYPPERSNLRQWTYWGFAAVVLVVTLYELFRFEELIESLKQINSIDVLAQPILASVVTMQVFALPYLLGMKTSLLMRYSSLACAVGSIVSLCLFAVLAL